MDDPRIAEGTELIQTIWYGLAIKIVNMAIRVYNLDEAQAKAVKEIYLRPNDYSVRLREE